VFVRCNGELREPSRLIDCLPACLPAWSVVCVYFFRGCVPVGRVGRSVNRWSVVGSLLDLDRSSGVDGGPAIRLPHRRACVSVCVFVRDLAAKERVSSRAREWVRRGDYRDSRDVLAHGHKNK
jgi:hypothetical protein